MIRYVITYINGSGQRTLVDPAQGRWTYATEEEATERLVSLIGNNLGDRLSSIFGGHPRFEIQPCECWAGHFDPKGIYFD